MGLPMTRNLLRAGYRVLAWNRSPGKLEEATRMGAEPRANAAEVARDAGVTFLCVSDGVARGAVAGTRLVDLGTTDPARTRAMAARLREQTGMGWVDSPVTGGQAGAVEGTLAFFAGGEVADVEAVRPCMAPLGRRFAHMGPVGAGQVTKLCNQIAVGVGLATVAELLAFAMRGGVDAARLPEVFEGGFADSTLMQRHAPKMVARDFTPRGRAETVLKDLDLIRGFAKGTGAPLPLTALAAELWRLHCAHGHARSDAVSIIDLFAAGPAQPSDPGGHKPTV
jgi:3-hydroxyisobutyrate dehydrogenase